ncbi:zinc finger BED domain-containing protein 5-like [Sipha flava]|uniref:Zinc finger BED domain-containing protein 5-like n=1 Tax=Sipha flava TaxID=143950 RepID=A0A8B8FPE1_9HEMI|nr:zinc finger BED domain-containing protein 5-like [Sipha flava]
MYGKLKRHFTTKHGHLLNKDKTYFSRLLSSNVKQSKQLEKLTNISDKSQIASYKVAELIVKKMQPHTIAENLILPACKEIVKSMLGDSAEKEVSRVPLSNNIISRRIDDMSSDIQKHVSEILCDDRKFSLQIDESTDISQKCQLLNGTPAMTDKFKGFVSKLKQNFPNIISTHCFIHREALMIKSIPGELKNVLDLVIKMVNYIKSRDLKTRILKKMCEEAGSRYEVLVLHTQIRWLSKGKDENILTSYDKLNGFLRKINLWISHVEKKQLQMFPLTANVDPDGEVTSDLIINHLIILKEKICCSVTVIRNTRINYTCT